MAILSRWKQLTGLGWGRRWSSAAAVMACFGVVPMSIAQSATSPQSSPYPIVQSTPQPGNWITVSGGRLAEVIDSVQSASIAKHATTFETGILAEHFEVQPLKRSAVMTVAYQQPVQRAPSRPAVTSSTPAAKPATAQLPEKPLDPPMPDGSVYQAPVEAKVQQPQVKAPVLTRPVVAAPAQPRMVPAAPAIAPPVRPVVQQETIPAQPAIQTTESAPIIQTRQPIPQAERDRIAVECPDVDELLSDLKPISELTTSITPSEGDLPPNCARDVMDRMNTPALSLQASRTPYMKSFAWVAPGLKHQPLYFEDAPLERYGQTISPFLQPVISGARFFAQVPMLPYKMALDPPHECQYTLGYFRPGSCAPVVRQQVPFDAKAAVVQGAVVAGLILLIP
ncbi:Hypothetical protein PBC10988_10270 [Planctomycetales bacterium 10988]|nr:Hypothetical protein PBC10988_10270 [Planctomycetales bacterium 10988]